MTRPRKPAGARRQGHREGRITAGALAVLAITTVSSCGVSASARAAHRPLPPQRGGTLISATLVAALPAARVAAELAHARLGPGDPALGARTVRYGIAAYRVVYRTPAVSGRPTRASGLVAFPDSRALTFRVVDYGHGTTADKRDVPSSFGLDAAGDGIEGRWAAELFASAGFVTTEPDYVGMGAGPGRPGYMLAATEASASLNLVRAAEQIAARRGGRLASRVLVTGFSQGGSAAMAIGNALQRGADPGIRLGALAPVSGPYDLTGAELPGVFNGQVAAGVAPFYVGYLLTAWNPVYHLYAAPRDAFTGPYATRAERLFDGSHPDGRIAAALPPSLPGLLTPGFLRHLRHPSGSLKRALLLNSTCTGWVPRVPVRLYAARGDHDVTEVNALHCLCAIRMRGGDVQLTELGPVSHDISDFLALPRIVRWFQQIR